jgi:Glycine transporter
LVLTTGVRSGHLPAETARTSTSFTIVGIILMAFLMGLGGGVTRDVLLTKIPGALTNPAYITVALAGGIIGYALAYDSGQLFREGWFQFMTSFSLAPYASLPASGVAGGQGVAVISAVAAAMTLDTSRLLCPASWWTVYCSTRPSTAATRNRTS